MLWAIFWYTNFWVPPLPDPQHSDPLRRGKTQGEGFVSRCLCVSELCIRF